MVRMKKEWLTNFQNDKCSSGVGLRLGRGSFSEQIANQIDNVTCCDTTVAVGISRFQRTRIGG